MKAGFDRVDGEIGELRAEIKDQGRELRAEMAGMEARLRAQASEHYVRTGEEFAIVRQELSRMHEDKQQILAGMQGLQRTVIQVGWAGAFTLIATIAGALIYRLF
jgi:hypothetical protein